MVLCRYSWAARGESQQGDQQNGRSQLTAGDLGVQNAHKQQRDGVQRHDHGSETAELKAGENKVVVKADHPNRDRGFVEKLPAGEQTNEGI